MSGNLVAFLSLLLNALLIGGLLSARNYLQARIEKGVQHNFDSKIELLRADIKARESEIAVLRTSVMGPRAEREALVAKRKLQAVEAVWKAVIALAPYRNLSAMMAAIKFKAVARMAPSDARIRKWMEMLTAHVPAAPQSDASAEQPFVSKPAWAFFLAYQLIVTNAYARATILKIGVEGAADLMNDEHVRKVLKAALPEMAGFIDSNEPESFHHLLEVIEARLLAELEKMLQGVEADQESVTHATRVLSALNEASNAKATSQANLVQE